VPVPGAVKKRIVLQGDVPSPINPPSGCRFHTRCPYAFDRCSIEAPQLREISAGHQVSCHLRVAPLS
jgi:peptide/nickel transport system ATP-binding protein